MGAFVHPAAVKALAEAAMRRPCDMSQAELEALPVGPHVIRERPITAEDRAKGIHGRCVQWAEKPAQQVSPYTDRDIIFFRDADGVAWMFGQWATGQWFKQPSWLP